KEGIEEAPTYLLNVKQTRNLSLRCFVNRFIAFMGGFQLSQLLFPLLKDPFFNKTELLSRVQINMNTEDTLLAHRGQEDRQEEIKKCEQQSKNDKANSPKKN
ncbi:unnamed protein product, partial [Ilex paraguariensis]